MRFKEDEYYLEISSGEIKLGKNINIEDEVWGLKMVDIDTASDDYDDYFLGLIEGKICCFERYKEIEP